MGHEENAEGKNDPDLGPNVIRIKPLPRFGFLGSMLIRIALGFLILGAGVAAVYYSIEVHSDSNNKQQELTKTFFTLNRTQYCIKGGIYTRESNNGADSLGNHNHTTIKTETVWVQDHDKKRLHYTLGKPNASDTTSFYIYENYMLTVQGNICTQQAIGYDQFIASRGITGLLYIRTEEIIRNEEPEGERAEEEHEDYVKINFFQGEPVSPESHDDHTEYPFLGFGYMDLSNSVAYAWQLYYEDVPENPVYFEEYWYPFMTSGKLDISYFDAPAFCPLSA